MKPELQFCDIVMEGGGVKGIGLVGALSVLAERGYMPRRMAGTSAGAIVGALTAAGMTVPEMRQLMGGLDYREFRDEGLIDRLGLPGKAASLLFERGIYEGNAVRELVAKELEKLGVVTFGDLKLMEPWAQKLPPAQRYKLVVLTADITRGRLVRLPWDYHVYGLDPDEQHVADAVRASMSIPFFYEPVHLGKSTLVDGGVLSNFPIDLFDDTPDAPTFGVKLSARADANLDTERATNPIGFTTAILSTMLNAHDQMHLDDPCVIRRTMFVDTLQIKATDFDITHEQQEQLYANGRHGAEKLLDVWDFKAYKGACAHPGAAHAK